MRIVGIDPTGSTWDRTEMCPASAALPQVFDGNPKPDRDKGDARHLFLQRIAELRSVGVSLADARKEALDEVDERWRHACEVIDLDRLGHRTTLSTEVAVAYNWKADTARILKPIAPRQYEVDETCEIAQTIDLAGVGDREVYSGDYKGPFAWLREPSKSLQLGGGGLCLARVFRARRAHLEYIRLNTDGSSVPWKATLDVFGIEDVAVRLQTMMYGVETMRSEIDRGIVPNVTEGPWCTYCNAKQHCPAKTALVRSVLAGDAKHKLSLRDPITPENVGTVYAMRKKVKEALRIVDNAIHAYEAAGEASTPGHVSSTAIPAGVEPDGSLRYFGRFEREGNEVIDGDIALDVLREKYGNAALEAFEVETSKTAIKDVVRSNKPDDVTLKDAEQEVFDEIRKRGGAKRPPTDKPAEFTVTPDGAVKKASRKKAS